MRSGKVRRLVFVLVLASCGDDAPPKPDAALPLCSDLGCNATLCSDCETTCKGERCYVPPRQP